MGNKCIRVVLMLCRLCIRLQVPFILENPFTSMLWDLPEIRELEATTGVYAQVADLCSFGTPWKKPTRFLIFGIDYSDSESLTLRCAGRGGMCSTSSKRHFLLEGPGPDGKPRTRTAQEYPRRLCNTLAWTLLAPYRNAATAFRRIR